MREVIIQQVRLCSSGRLRLRPTPSRPSGYNYIWRDASSVRWDDVTGELYVHVVSESTPQDEIKLMIAAGGLTIRLMGSESAFHVGVFLGNWLFCFCIIKAVVALRNRLR
jgi:hypothetical protein